MKNVDTLNSKIQEKPTLYASVQVQILAQTHHVHDQMNVKVTHWFNQRQDE